MPTMLEVSAAQVESKQPEHSQFYHNEGNEEQITQKTSLFAKPFVPRKFQNALHLRFPLLHHFRPNGGLLLYKFLPCLLTFALVLQPLLLELRNVHQLVVHFMDHVINHTHCSFCVTPMDLHAHNALRACLLLQCIVHALV
uniref:Uncharacterized protein n=1 Tax=Trypanosoma congolense (strain IL3000) TaxID=1068625 RepID=F9WF90_TRYCI|nr:hypothetical protein, unlikely [Trypanosoma congolense IL3000]